MRPLFFALIATLFIASCSGMKTHTEVEALKEAKAVGSPFTQRLTTEYKAIVKDKQFFLDYSDARHFAKKGLMAAEGKTVMPELLSNWHLDETSIQTLSKARAQLVALLEGGGRTQAPFEAAIAQAKFDCWVEQQEQYWISPVPAKCKGHFETAMKELRTRLKGALPTSVKADEPITETTPATIKETAAQETDPSAVSNTMDEGMFLVFFDFDRSTLTDSGRAVVSSIAQQAKQRKDTSVIRITGHADTSGSTAYNQRLSQRRAEAVKNALVSMGVSGLVVRSEGMGESNLMVQTPNNTREPANRRAEIRFE